MLKLNFVENKELEEVDTNIAYKEVFLVPLKK